MRRLSRSTGLTGTGLAVALGSMVLLTAGTFGGYPTLGGLGAAGMAVVLAAALMVRMPARVRVARTVAPHRVTVGDQVTGWLEVSNTGRLRTGRFEAVDGLTALGPTGTSGRTTGGGLRIPVPPLSPGGTTRLSYPVPTPDRGVLRLGPVRLHRRDPLGLARRSQTLAAPDRIWIRPRVHPVRPLPIGPVLDFEGRLTDRVLRGSMAFAALREYRPGDDPRQIHWRSTARAGELIVQDRVDTTEPSAVVLLDTRAAVFGSELFEEAVELTASVVVSTSRSGQSVTLAVFDEDAATLARLGARGPLDRLAAASRTDGGDLTALLALLGGAPAGGGLVVVSGADPTLAPALAGQLRRYAGIVLVQLVADGSAEPDAGSAGTSVSVQSGLVVIRAHRARAAAIAYSGLAGGTR